jgi:hypothetical protein
METFVVYDARRERAFVRFLHGAKGAAEAGRLDAGFWVEFAAGDPAAVALVIVEHMFFARPDDFVDRVSALVGDTVVRRLRECHLRAETVAEVVRLDDLERETVTAAWHGLRQELRVNALPADPESGDRQRPGADRQWVVSMRLEPVLARATSPAVTVRPSFDGRVELPSELAGTLRVERVVRVAVAAGVLRLRGRVRAGEKPPPGAGLGLVGGDRVAALVHDSVAAELSAEIVVGESLGPLRDGDIVSLLRFHVPRDRG